MNPEREVHAAIEAVVMAAVDPVPPAVIAQLVELPTARVEEICDELEQEYVRDGRGFTLARVAGGYRYQTHPDAYPYVERFVLDGQTARLSGPALETLAIIAYKQPIGRAQLSAIRGVNVDATLKTLVARGYVEEIGHDPTPGNPSLFGTTDLFLDRLGLDAVDQLPALGDFVPDSSIVEALERGLHIPGATEDPEPAELAAELQSGLGDDEPEPSVVQERAGERLQKVLARAGFGSRRASEQLIAEGRVAVDGEVAILGARVDIEHARVTVDGVPVVTETGIVHWLLNKPVGRVTTASDPQGRATVLELVPSTPRVFPVGRLDRDTEGLLILTNDGDLAELLTHPRHGVEKEYLAEVDGIPTAGELRQLREGVELEDGPTRPARVRLVQEASDRGSALVEIVVKEGRKRMVRRMCSAVGHPVRRLVRTRIGPLRDAKLGPSEWRELTAEEVRGLYVAAMGEGAVLGEGEAPPD